MSSLSDFFLAEKNSTPSYNSDSQYPDKCEFRSLSVLEVAGILAVLNDGDAIELLDEFKLLTPEDAEEWLYAIPDEMVQLLSSIQENEIANVAEKCAIETEEEIEWEASDFIPVITELRSLAIKANEQSKGMYFWNSL